MALFKLNWNLDGFRDELHKAGEVIEADFDEVKQWVEKKFGGDVAAPGTAVLTPVDAAEVTATTDAGTQETAIVVPGGDVDLDALTKAQIAAHAAEHHDLDLNPDKATKPELIAAVEAARVDAVTPAAEVTATADAGTQETATA